MEKDVYQVEKKSNLSQRNWILGNCELPTGNRYDNTIVFNEPHNNTKGFSYIVSIFTQIQEYIKTQELHNEISECITNIYKNAPTINPNRETSNFLASSISYAIMRRISRESVYTALLIDNAAKLLNTCLRYMKLTMVHVPDIISVDRPSLKILTRAMLLITSTDHTYHWYFKTNPFLITERDNLLYKSRKLLFERIASLVAPNIKNNCADNPGTQQEPVYQFSEQPLYDVSCELVIQSYDACIVACQQLLNSKNTEYTYEAHRLIGLALVNAGMIEDGVTEFKKARKATNRLPQKAHISYLLGLIYTKRYYHIEESEKYFNEGLEYLKKYQVSDFDYDPVVESLERAWLYNGLALNSAIMGKNGDNSAFDKSFALASKAFSLVQNRYEKAEVYLKFNLLANLAFLMEIQGKYTKAIRIFEKTFDDELYNSSDDKIKWKTILGYRLGLLYYKSGNTEKSLEQFNQFMPYYKNHFKEPYMQERILRAYGFILLKSGHVTEALNTFQEGKNICEQEYFTEGFVYHCSGILTALNALKKTQDKLFKNIKGQLDRCHVDIDFNNINALLSFPSPKLPAYIPEIDLEDIPGINLNLFFTDTYTKIVNAPIPDVVHN